MGACVCEYGPKDRVRLISLRAECVCSSSGILRAHFSINRLALYKDLYTARISVCIKCVHTDLDALQKSTAIPGSSELADLSNYWFQSAGMNGGWSEASMGTSAVYFSCLLTGSAISVFGLAAERSVSGCLSENVFELKGRKFVDANATPQQNSLD